MITICYTIYTVKHKRTGAEMNTRTHKPTKEISKDIRRQLKAEFPNCKFSVITKHSNSIDVHLMQAPFKVFAEDGNGRMKDSNGYNIQDYAQLNEYQLQDKYRTDNTSNGHKLTEKAWDVLSKAAKILNEQNWDNSDLMTDYFDVNYYTSISIGKWDKPFELVQ
jgi:hypothetical protein